MKYGLDVPPFEEYSDPRVMAEFAYEAEQAGWDAFFTWDHLWLGMREPLVDPWVALSVVAMRTERIRIGAMVTPVARATSISGPETLSNTKIASRAMSRTSAPLIL